MRIAIPIWEEKVSPVFDTAIRLLVVEVENNKEASRFLYFIDENDLAQKCNRIRKLKLDILICGAVSHPFLHMLLASGLNVIQQISGSVEEVLEACNEISSHFSGELTRKWKATWVVISKRSLTVNFARRV